MRQAFAGMLWSKQFYNYDVATWLDGDPAQPPPPRERELNRNARWRNFNAFDILSMPDKWEYPWFAAWDLAFHCVSLAHVDPGFAKYQLVLLCREWFQHPNGALPAYEWDFSDVNPPVQAWAALEVFALDGAKDFDFLARIFDKLLVNFTWWVNREDVWGNDLFEGGFLGLDNIGPIDRSHLPPGTVLEQSDATGWMAFYALSMATIALILWRNGRQAGADLVLKFLEHYAGITTALETQGMWDDADGMFYDHLCLASGAVIPVKARSMVGMIPLLAVGVVDHQMVVTALRFKKAFADFLHRQGLTDADKAREMGLLRDGGDRVAGFGRLEDGLKQSSPWYTWGPYVSERQWGTVREDYSEDGDAWNYLPHDQARSRAYRWGEDGLAGFSDVEQRLCLGLALWNGRDPFLKERLFGLTGPEGNHGEDVKEHWWYLDALPSHAWNRWRYHYPQAPFPYDQLRVENARRDRRSPEYEILDTGIFDTDRYWITEVATRSPTTRGSC